MPLAKALSISLYGMTGRLIEVEADISSNLPAFVLVGLPDASVNESAARVRAATTNSKLPLPGRRITVNLSPASVPKQGSGFDLAIAMATLSAAGTVDQNLLAKTVFLGELSLDGSIKPITGILTAVIAAKQLEMAKVVVPLGNLAEAQLVSGIEIRAFDHLTQLVASLGVNIKAREIRFEKVYQAESAGAVPCFSEVVGQPEALEALKVAAVGGHNLLMLGPPGAGKTMLASRLPGILPELTEDQAIELCSVQSLAKLPILDLPKAPPIQAPHHTASLVSMVGGGGAQPKPGLISLAHNGVLFLDEAPEFQSSVLEALRQPLESGFVTISRASGQATFPARFQLVLAANPCPCGFAIGTGKECTCSSVAKTRYLNRISGPLSDRLDLRLELNSVNAALVSEGQSIGSTSKELKDLVTQARAASRERLKHTPWVTNSEVSGSFLRRELRLPKTVTSALDRALDRAFISMRGYDRCLKVAWSLADLRGANSPDSSDLATAIFLRGAEI